MSEDGLKRLVVGVWHFNALASSFEGQSLCEQKKHNNQPKKYIATTSIAQLT
jgi:hypothetical protein